METKFKKGDKVRLVSHELLIGANSRQKWSEKEGLIIGDIFTVYDVSRAGNIELEGCDYIHSGLGFEIVK